MVVRVRVVDTMEPPTTNDVPAMESNATEPLPTADTSETDPRHKAPGPARRFAESREVEPDQSVTVDPDDLLSVLEDDYARRILNAVAADPRPARELMEVCDASRATVYRRLNRLEEQDLVTSRTEVHPDGHHRKVFEATLEEVTLSLDGDGISAEVTVEDAGTVADTPARHERIGADD
jgi:DNA-binding transcriptional ArsR family regulator